MRTPNALPIVPGGDVGLVVSLARTEEDVRAAQRLRWQVFVEELGARVESEARGLDADRFDAHCDHLLVRERDTGDVVGTYRMLPPERVVRAGGLLRGDRVPPDPPARHRSAGRGGTRLRAAGLPDGLGDLAPLDGPAAIPPRRRTRVRDRVRQYRARRRHARAPPRSAGGSFWSTRARPSGGSSRAGPCRASPRPRCTRRRFRRS